MRCSERRRAVFPALTRLAIAPIAIINRRGLIMHLLIRHKVADFAKWKPVYDGHLSARQKAGVKEEHLFRNADDPNEVLLLFSAEDIDKAKVFIASDDVHQTMAKAGGKLAASEAPKQ